MDAAERIKKVVASSTIPFFTSTLSPSSSPLFPALTYIPTFRTWAASRAYLLLDGFRKNYLSGARLMALRNGKK